MLVFDSATIHLFFLFCNPKLIHEDIDFQKAYIS